jgi:ATP/maltotriose-dependent transcriptional regulator MalT
MGLQLMAANVSDLVRRTEGWVAGLQMAALAPTRRDQSDASRRGGSGTPPAL